MPKRKAPARRPKDDEFSKEDVQLARWVIVIYDFTRSATKKDRALLGAWIETGNIRSAVRRVAPKSRTPLALFERRLTQMRERLVRIVTLLPPGAKQDMLLRHLRVDKRGPRGAKPLRLARVTKMRKPK